MEVLLANPRGFCAGVDRAIEIVEQALAHYGAPIYVRNEVVHNRFVVQSLKDKGAIFVREIDEVPENAVVIYSAHGVSKKVMVQSKVKQLRVLDATCPLVTKVHKNVIRYQKQGAQVILIGHKGHPEVEGTLGQSLSEKAIFLVENSADIKALNISKNDKVAYTTQTTLSMDDTKNLVTELTKKLPHIEAPKTNDICYATQNRQDAVKKIMRKAEVLIVLGSANSSNSNRLKEIAQKLNKPAYLIDGADEISQTWLKDKKTVGVTAGASAPESLVVGVVERLKKFGASRFIEVSGRQESLTFPLPKSLRTA